MASTKDLRALWLEIKDETDENKVQEKIANLSEEELSELANQTDLISPYSFPNIVDGDVVLFSVLNMKEEYIRKETAVSFSSFIYRMLSEEIPDEDFSQQEKDTINRFLGKYLEFNPDIHVKSSYNKKNPKDIFREDMSSLDRELVRNIAPEDTFRRWKLYHDANYDALRKATNILYSDKPDIEHAIIVYEMFKNKATKKNGKTAEEASKEFIKKYKDDFKMDVLTVRKGKWVFVGPFAQNREKVEIYSKDSEILEELLKKREEEMKTGQDMLKNRVRKEKKKHGQSDENVPELNEYKEIIQSLTGKGVKRLNKDELRKLNSAHEHIRLSELNDELAKLSEKGINNFTADDTFRYRELNEQIKAVKESMEIPDGAIQVNVYEATEDGNFEVNKIYTKAETEEETLKRLREEELSSRFKQ